MRRRRSDYEKQSPRFMRNMVSVVSANRDGGDIHRSRERNITSPVMLAYQRHPRGNQLIREYMLREYPEPKDLNRFYTSSGVAAEGIKTELSTCTN